MREKGGFVIVRFTVLGVPAPQGSKTRTRWGMREANPNTKPWRQAVAAEAMTTRTAFHDGAHLPFPSGPLAVHADLLFPRPKSHYGTGRNASRLKETAPDWHTSPPDADKLARALGDAMTGIVFRDDSQVACWTICKHYGEPARAEITVSDAWSWTPGGGIALATYDPKTAPFPTDY